MYTFDSRVRYSEVGTDRKLKMTSVLDYFQDCTTFQSEHNGGSFSLLEPLHLAWVLYYWQIDVKRFADMCEQVKVSTIPYEFKGCLGMRNFAMEGADGKQIAMANSIWTLLDIEKQSMVKVEPWLQEHYTIEQKLDMEYLPRKIIFTCEGQKLSPFTVTWQQLDCNMHVNNGQYVKMAMDYLPADFKPNRLRAVYLKQAHLGDKLIPLLFHENENCMGISLTDEMGEEYCKIEFSKIDFATTEI